MCAKHGSKCLGVDDQVAVGELEVEEFHEVAGGVGSDAHPFGGSWSASMS